MTEAIDKPKRGGAWKPGESGNPTGKKGTSQGITALRDMIKPHMPKIIKKLAEQALAGDVAAARVLVERAIPAYRSEAPAVLLPAVSEAATLTDKGRAVLDAAAGGEIPSTTAGELLGSLAGVAKLTEIDEQQRAIDELRAQLGGDDAADLV